MSVCFKQYEKRVVKPCCPDVPPSDAADKHRHGGEPAMELIQTAPPVPAMGTSHTESFEKEGKPHTESTEASPKTVLPEQAREGAFVSSSGASISRVPVQV